MKGETPIFRREEVRKLLISLKNGTVNIIKPEIDYERGINYRLSNKIINGISPEDLELILSELESLGILQSASISNIAVCPKCGSHKLMLQLHCPSCGSPTISKNVMIEHVACGYFDSEEKFRRGEILICPKCGKTLKAIGVDYRKPGALYRCLRCGKLFPAVSKIYTCNGGHSFTESELILREVKEYRVNHSKLTLIESEIVDYPRLLKEFDKKIWKVEAPSKIVGKSGIEHEFTFALRLNGENQEQDRLDIVADLYSHEKEVELEKILAFQAKVTDVKPNESILMVIPKLEKSGKVLGESYGIHVVEANDAKELSEKVKKLLHDVAEKKEEKMLREEAEALEESLNEIEDKQV